MLLIADPTLLLIVVSPTRRRCLFTGQIASSTPLADTHNDQEEIRISLYVAVITILWKDGIVIVMMGAAAVIPTTRSASEGATHRIFFGSTLGSFSHLQVPRRRLLYPSHCSLLPVGCQRRLVI